MEELFNYELLQGKIIPAQAVMYLLAGYFATEKLNIHNTILFFNGKKAWAVAAASLPFAVGYIATGCEWQSVLITFFFTNTVYEYAAKFLINKITNYLKKLSS